MNIRKKRTWKGQDIEIFGLYTPTDNNIGTRKEIALMGNFKAWTGREIHDKVVEQYGDNKTNDSAERLIEFCQLNFLKIPNGFYTHKEIREYTWTLPSRNTKSIINYVTVKKDIAIVAEDVRVIRGPECETDHDLIRDKCHCPQTKVQPSNSIELSLGTTQLTRGLNIFPIQTAPG